MRVFYAFALLLTLFTKSFAQEQITKFKNPVIQSPNSFTKLDTINGKIIFSAFTPEASNTNIYTSNGTPVGTSILVSGNEISYFGNSSLWQKERNYGYMFYVIQHILFRTDGVTFEKIFDDKSQKISLLKNIGNHVYLVTTSDTTIDGYAFAQRSKLLRINQDMRIETIETNIAAFNFTDNQLFYLKKLPDEADARIISFSQNESKKVEGSHPYLNANLPWELVTFTVGRSNFHFVTQNTTTRLFLTDSLGNQKSIPWGDYFSRPRVLQANTTPKTYILQVANLQLSIVEVTETGNLIIRHTVAFESFSPRGNAGRQTYYDELFYQKNRLFFYSQYGAEGGIYLQYLHEYNFDKNEYRVSKNLVENYNRAYNYYIRPVPLGNGKYMLDGWGKLSVFDFETNRIISSEPKPVSPPDTTIPVYRLGNQQAILTDNLYQLTAEAKLPLVQTKEFFGNSWSKFSKAEVNGKLLFFKQNYNYTDQTYNNILWATEGSKNSTVKLVECTGELIEPFGISRSKLYFHCIDPGNQKLVTIYETDGTVAGTKVRYETDSSDVRRTSSVSGPFVNNSQVVYVLFDKLNNAKLLTLDEGAPTLLNPPGGAVTFDLVMTKNNFYAVTNSDNKNSIKNSYYILKEREFVYLTDSRISYRTADNLFFSDTNDEGRAKGIYYFKEGEKKWITDKLIGNFFYHQSYFVLHNENEILVLNTQSDKITKISEITDHNYILSSLTVLDNGFVLSAGQKLFFSVNDRIFTYQTKRQVKGVEIVKEGVLIIEGLIDQDASYLTYFNSSEGKFYAIVDNSEYQSVITDDKSDFAILMIPRAKSLTFDYQYFNFSDKKLIPIIKQEGFFFDDLIANKVTHYQNSGEWYLWSYNGETFEQRYELQNPSSIKRIGPKIYGTYFTKETGPEIVEFGLDSILFYPEIVPGKLGVQVENHGTNSIFQYRDQLYTYGFTFTNGTQVWRLGSVRKNESVTDKPTATDVDFNVTIYPNPTTGKLIIETAETLNYQLVNLAGSILNAGTVKNLEILNISNLPHGTYIFQFTTENKKTTRKIVKVN